MRPASDLIRSRSLTKSQRVNTSLTRLFSDRKNIWAQHFYTVYNVVESIEFCILSSCVGYSIVGLV